MNRSPNFRATLARAALLALVARGGSAQGSQATVARAPVQPADVIVTADRIYTVDRTHPLAEALATRDGRIVFAGSRQAALALKGTSTRMLDYPGRTIVPGIVDAHAHLLGLGQSLRNVDLVGAKSYDEAIARVVARAKELPAGAWVLGRGWDQNQWGDTRFPTHEALSRAVPANPAALTRVDGHATLANAKAMSLAGVTAATKDPPGGRIVRLPGGEPSGVFVDNAQGMIGRVVPAGTAEEAKRDLVRAIAECNRWGLVGIHDAGASADEIRVYEEIAKAGGLNLRLYVMLGDDARGAESVGRQMAEWFARGPQIGLYDGRLWVRSVKLYMDGALGSRGAALLDPYSDDPGNSGLLVSDPRHIRAVAVEALRHGFQVNVHAIGDRANRLVLDAFESALTEVPVADHRFRIEHAQIIEHGDIPRFARLGVIPSMQAVHQTSDMYWAGSRLGTGRLYGAYAWRSLIDAGSIIPNGSDFPVEAVNPLLSFHSAVSREDAHDWPPGGWHPEQRMTREEALESITLWPATAAFQEDVMGSISPGKYADFVVLDQDIMRVAPSQILQTQVVATWIGGKAVYERR
ncbi:MAG: amidohydrolase [Gemmatimonadota bacterium]|nr:amidohydrolase [Gemmatimonadota bacterium]